MRDLLLFSIAAFSLTFGIIESPNYFIKKFRTMIETYISEKLVICYHCCGFWISLFLSPFLLHQLKLNILYSFLIALYGGGIVYLIHVVEDYICELTIKTKER